MSRKLLWTAAVLLPLLFSRAAAEPLRLRSTATCTTEGGSSVTLPPGWYFDEPDFDELDGEVRRLQESETRLRAENKSLRETPSNRLKLLLGVAAGLAVGYFVGNSL